MIESTDGAQNVSLKAKEWDGELIFLHDLDAGAADKSYGIQVAKLAGLPPGCFKSVHKMFYLCWSPIIKIKAHIIDDLPLV